MLASISFAFSITGPIFLLILLGLVLRRIGLFSQDFAAQASTLCFKLFLPTLLFFNILELPLVDLFKPSLLAIALGVTLVLFVLLELVVKHRAWLDNCRGEFVQSCFRGNLAIIGLAFCERAYGDQGLGLASMIVALLTILYNVLAVITLQRHLAPSGSGLREQVGGVLKNPLIVAICLALLLNPISDWVPVFIKQTGHYLAQPSLPLALLCVGASLSFRGAASNVKAIAWVSIIKLIVKPAVAVLLMVFLGFSGLEIGIVFLLLSAPVAAASFVMVAALRGNSAMVANFIVYSALFSLFTVSAGLAVLRQFNII